jgi:alanine racemase
MLLKPTSAPIGTATSQRSARVTRSTIAEVDLTALAFNLKGVRQRVGPGVSVMAVVKANAYGHGMVDVARFAEGRSADAFGVALAEEGVTLRKAGITSPILAFTLPSKAQAELYPEFGLEATVCSLTEARHLNRAGERRRRTVPVHIKVDTGMNRLGLRVEHLAGYLGAMARLKRLEVKGIFTQFATADERNKKFAYMQLGRFCRALDIAHQERALPEVIHMANSAAILDLPESTFTMVRPGIMIYGYYPSRETTESVPLRPVMTLKSRVSFVKWIKAGDGVGYNRRFVARRRTQIATLPIGYGDGYSRLLSGKASVLLNGRRYPIAGTIAMDQMMVDVGTDDVAQGDEAILIGEQEKERITAWDLADPLGTIPYEVCCWVNTRVPRVYLHRRPRTSTKGSR